MWGCAQTVSPARAGARLPRARSDEPGAKAGFSGPFRERLLAPMRRPTAPFLDAKSSKTSALISCQAGNRANHASACSGVWPLPMSHWTSSASSAHGAALVMNAQSTIRRPSGVTIRLAADAELGGSCLDEPAVILPASRPGRRWSRPGVWDGGVSPPGRTADFSFTSGGAWRHRSRCGRQQVTPLSRESSW